MTRRSAWLLGWAVLVPTLWLVVASAIWDGGTGKPFVPWGWWLALDAWPANWYAKLWIIVGGLIPTLVLLIIARGMSRYRSPFFLPSADRKSDRGT